eukprot:6177661-Pleurochrysis_carterae.AAC.1
MLVPCIVSSKQLAGRPSDRYLATLPRAPLDTCSRQPQAQRGQSVTNLSLPDCEKSIGKNC